jgi:hypothetical protein
LLLIIRYLRMVFSGHRAVPSAIIEGGGGAYSYIRVLPDGFLWKAIVFTVCEHEYMNTPPLPPPPIIASIGTALSGQEGIHGIGIFFCFLRPNVYHAMHFKSCISHSSINAKKKLFINLAFSVCTNLALRARSVQKKTSVRYFSVQTSVNKKLIPNNLSVYIRFYTSSVYLTTEYHGKHTRLLFHIGFPKRYR